MEWLNYHHLLCFYTVAKEGSVTKASEVLHLAQPTLSGQIRKLEAALDENGITDEMLEKHTLEQLARCLKIEVILDLLSVYS